MAVAGSAVAGDFPAAALVAAAEVRSEPAHQADVEDRPRNFEPLSELAHQRLYPSLTDPSYLVLRSRRLIFSRWVEALPGEHLTVLDVGGRYQPYLPLFGGRIHQYVSVDLIQTPAVSAVADAHCLPFPPETFDVVIATQVLDYVRDPAEAVRQIHSVLKPGGTFLASAPACAPSFAEGERWRFLTPGLRLLLAPFATVEVVAELFSLGSTIRTVNLALDTFVRYRAARLVYRRTVCPVLNLLGRAAESFPLTTNDQFTANYSIRAVKG